MLHVWNLRGHNADLTLLRPKLEEQLARVATIVPTLDDTVAAGGRMFGQGTTKSINAIFSLKSYLPFDVLPASGGAFFADNMCGKPSRVKQMSSS